LLIRLPYRPPLVNGIYTAAYLLSAYAYLRHRLDLAIPPLILLCPVLSVAVDVLGNALGLYGTRVGAVEFDDLTHVVAGALALPPVMWLTGEVARRQSVPLPRPFLALLATCVTFSLSAYYEIVELWDELFLGGARLWDAHDSPSDLQWNLLGIVVAAILAVTMRGRRPNNDLLGPPTP
jgi:uncharacterized membrane protein YjdF